MPKSPHHSHTRPEEQVLIQAVQDEWQEMLVPLLPQQFLQQAKQLKAFERAKGLRGAGDLLRGRLAYAFCLSSFRQVGAWASSLGINPTGERSWAKGTRQARLWLLWLMPSLLMPPVAHNDLPAGSTSRVLLVDASNLRGWHQQGKPSRLQVSYDLQARRIARVVLTDQQSAERLTTFASEPGTILVADRGSCCRQALWDVLQAGGEIVVRLQWSNVPLQHEDGSTRDLCQWVNGLPCDWAEQTVWMQGRTQRVALRLLAHRLSPQGATRAQRRHQRKARKNGYRQRHPWTQVLTSLEARAWEGSRAGPPTLARALADRTAF